MSPVSSLQGHWDQGHYMYFNRTGDVTVTCRVDEITESTTGSLNYWVKGGIMFRNGIIEGSYNGRAAHSSVFRTSYHIAHQTRPYDLTHTLSSNDNWSPMTNVWLRLVKQGDTVTSYVKKEGDYDWMYWHSETVTFDKDWYLIGLALTAHDNAQYVTMSVSNFEISDDVYTQNGAVATDIESNRPVRVQQVKPGIWNLQASGNDIGVSHKRIAIYILCCYNLLIRTLPHPTMMKSIIRNRVQATALGSGGQSILAMSPRRFTSTS